MALKEIKERINSIRSTRKTTAAMKMVSSAKLRKAQTTINNMLPYAASLQDVMQSLLSAEFTSPLHEVRELNNVSIITFSSNNSLCGAFNANIIREMQKTLGDYGMLPEGNVHLYTIGKKVYDAAKKYGYRIEKNFPNLAGESDYETIAGLAVFLMEQFEKGGTDRVEIIYHHFKSAGSQLLVHETLLPLTRKHSDDGDTNIFTDYILEPSREALLQTLLPKSIKLQLYTALLDSNASEHAARMIAMQTATDNADELINELTIEYNKSRQQAITNELLDIVGGAMR